ncbi:MAG: CsbD family protein [Gammaproteobacteria bacterium]|nr:CsbD family protein [Gammaproteobacteria bacterium]
MNWNIVEGNWKQLKGKVRAGWGKLTDRPVDVVAGKGEEVVGKAQEAYGVTADEAAQQVKDLEKGGKE